MYSRQCSLEVLLTDPCMDNYVQLRPSVARDEIKNKINALGRFSMLLDVRNTRDAHLPAQVGDIYLTASLADVAPEL